MLDKVNENLSERNLIEAVIDFGYPPCFESKKKYKDWLEAERSAPTMPFRRNVCEDCTFEYQTTMRLVNRCVNPQMETEK